MSDQSDLGAKLEQLGQAMQQNGDPGQQPSLVVTEDRLRAVVAEGVESALVRIGIRYDQPIEMQQDFQFLRDWRSTTNSVQKKGILTMVGLLVTGTAAALWLGIKALLNHN